MAEEWENTAAPWGDRGDPPHGTSWHFDNDRDPSGRSSREPPPEPQQERRERTQNDARDARRGRDREDRERRRLEAAGALLDYLGMDPERLLTRYRQQVEAVAAIELQIAEKKAEIAELAAKYSGNNKAGAVSQWEHDRKALLSRLQEAKRHEILTAPRKDGEKPAKVVEAMLESYAHAHPDYTKLLDEARGERIKYEKAQAEISKLYAKRGRELGVQRYITQRLKTVDALAYAFGGEARLSPR